MLRLIDQLTMFLSCLLCAAVTRQNLKQITSRGPVRFAWCIDEESNEGSFVELFTCDMHRDRLETLYIRSTGNRLVWLCLYGDWREALLLFTSDTGLDAQRHKKLVTSRWRKVFQYIFHLLLFHPPASFGVAVALLRCIFVPGDEHARIHEAKANKMISKFMWTSAKTIILV